MPIKIKNRDARRLWLQSHGLSHTPTGPLDLLELIKSLGFVQLDSIRNVTRAHHHILWSRNQNYREPMLWELLSEKRALFEHFTHDAALIPMDFYPMWRRQFSRLEKKFGSSWYVGTDQREISHDEIKSRIEIEGPLSTKAFETKIKVQKFWDACNLSEVKDWADNTNTPVRVEIQNHDGSWTDALAARDIETRLANIQTPTSRLRIINPFDPAIRDRDRLKRLFGMDYKIEIFVPSQPQNVFTAITSIPC